MQITRGYIPSGQKVILYGPEGIGKTTLASQFPNPVFIDTEGSTKHYDVARFPAPTSWEMLKQEAEYPLTHPGEVGTLVIDTADWAEKLCNQAVCQRANKDSIEAFGYGKGYTYAAEEFCRLLDILNRVADTGVHVVITAHAQLRKVEQPDEMTSYDRWELKCSKQLSPLLKEWADMVLFLNYKTIVVQSESGKGKAQGGRRVIYTTHHTCWDAKNRCRMEDELPLDWRSISFAFQPQQDYADYAYTPPVEPVPVSAPAAAAPGADEASVTSVQFPEEPVRPEPEPDPFPAADAAEPPDAGPGDPYAGLYPPLADLMRTNGVTVDQIQQAVGAKGYFPADMPVDQYPQDFIEGCLVAAWPQVYTLIRQQTPPQQIPLQELSGEDDDLPFTVQ